MAPGAYPHANFSVGIIGAGLGGLTLARVLQNRGLNVTVFERDVSAVSRDQGGTLDLHPEGGQQALDIAGLMPEFHRIASTEADAMRIMTKSGKVTFDDEEFAAEHGSMRPPGGEPHHQGEEGQQGPPGVIHGRPEVDRGLLRQILLDSLLLHTVIWGQNLSFWELGGNGKVEVVFAHSHSMEPRPQRITATFDMVVGADGTWSSVRPSLSTAQPEYTGVSFLDLEISDVDGAHPEVAKLVGKGSLCALGDDRALIAQRNSGGKVRLYGSFRVPLSWSTSSGIAALVAEEQYAEVKEMLLAEFADWSDGLKAMISAVDVEKSTFAVRPLMMLPLDHVWNSIGRVTLIGDAAHVMPPFAGEGANLAMLDGAELGEAIANWKDTMHEDVELSLLEVVENFEKRMLARSKEKSEESIKNQRLFMGEDAAETAGNWMRHLMSQGPPP